MFTEIPGPSTFGSYNVHNVLAGSNHFDLGVYFVGLGGFPKPNTQIFQYLGGEGYTAMIQEQITQIWSLDTMSMCS